MIPQRVLTANVPTQFALRYLQLVSEHVLGASDDIDEFVMAFVEKRKASDYLRVGAVNVCRFAASDIAEYKATFKTVRWWNGVRDNRSDASPNGRAVNRGLQDISFRLVMVILRFSLRRL